MKAQQLNCCGQKMQVRMETALYYELVCKKCNDTVYVKKERGEKPVLLDD